MTPTPEVSERARALREAADEPVMTALYRACHWFGGNLSDLEDGEAEKEALKCVAAILRAIVTEFGITQEMVTEINAAWPMDPDSSLLGDAADALSVLLAAAGSE